MSDVVMRYLAEANKEYQSAVERAIVYAMEQGFSFDDLMLQTPCRPQPRCAILGSTRSWSRTPTAVDDLHKDMVVHVRWRACLRG
jgi:hypothetical protein